MLKKCGDLCTVIAVVAWIFASATAAYCGVQALAVRDPSAAFVAAHSELSNADTQGESRHAGYQGKDWGGWIVSWAGRFGKWLVHDATGVFTFFLVVVTGGLAVYTFRLWRDGRDSIDLARKQFAAVNRPSLRIKHVWLKEKILPEQRIKVDLEIVNNGLTDAIVQNGNIRSITLAKGQKLPPRFLHEHHTFVFDREAISPGLTIWVKDYFIHDGMNAAELDEIKAGTRLLYLIGSFEYLDSDKRIRNTTFCRVLEISETDGDRFYRHQDPDYEYED